MSRLLPLDRVLLLVLGPLWLLGFGFHVANELRGGIAEPGVYVTSEGPDGYPAVQSIREGGAVQSPGLRPGDVLTRIGTFDLRGVGPLGFFSRANAAMGPDLRARVETARDGQTAEVWMDFTPMPLTIRFILVSVSFAVTAILLLMRAPRSYSARASFRALLLFSFGFLRPWSGSVEANYFWILGLTFMALFIFPLGVINAQSFPDDVDRRDRWSRVWPWIFAPIGPIFAAGVAGLSIPGATGNVADTAAMALLFVLGVVLLVLMTRGFRRADPIGRRKIKWVVYGFYVSLTPVLAATLVSIIEPELWWVSDASEIFEVLIPVFMLIAILRFNLYDINRLISATASYSVLVGGLLVAAFVLVPYLASAASEATGIGASASQLALSIALVGLLLPIQRYANPLVDRWLFPERQALQEAVEGFLDELSGMGTPRDLTMHAARRIHELLRPESMVVYVRSTAGYEPVFVRECQVPSLFDARHPAIAALRLRTTPVAAARWSKQKHGVDLSPFDRAALDTIGVVLLLPVHLRDDLAAFVGLGPKRSGDIYTATDLALLTAVTERVAAELLRFDDDEIIRQGQAMQHALRRYVPGAIADEIVSGQPLESGEREVSVMFVDIRGYASYAERLHAEQIFSTVNRYTEAVSDLVRRHGGSVVEFNGDGMMAVFGAPRALAGKERAALEAALEIAHVVGSLEVESADGRQRLSVGVGIATGTAFVGSIRAVDRLIWSAIGNTTNLAARLQGLTRTLEAAIVIDEGTWTAGGGARGKFEKRSQVEIRGRSDAQDVYLLPLDGS